MSEVDKAMIAKINAMGKAQVHAWTEGVPIEIGVWDQLKNLALMPFVKGIAGMPDMHQGIGSTVGTVFASTKAIIPATVGVDIGCGMVAIRTSLVASDLPTDLKPLREAWERTVPVGFGLHQHVPKSIETFWKHLDVGYDWLKSKYPNIVNDKHPVNQLGTLGGGNHFIELCLDLEDRVWVVVHSGSRGIGNKIGTYFINEAKEIIAKTGEKLPHSDLSYLSEGTAAFDDYIKAMTWAQDYAATSREAMLQRLLSVLREEKFGLPKFTVETESINCHHNYVTKEIHFGEEVFVTRKGAVRAGLGDRGIIPGSMGAKSYIVRGLGNPQSYMSCSHGAGRVMSRSKAKTAFTLEDHIAATAGVECRKDAGVIDETPGAYKDIDAVMEAQKDLVEIEHQLKQILCIKG